MCRLGISLAAAVLLLISPAFAQQQPDPAFLQRVIPPLQQQRNEAYDKAALAEARAALLAEEVKRLQAELDKAKPKE